MRLYTSKHYGPVSWRRGCLKIHFTHFLFCSILKSERLKNFLITILTALVHKYLRSRCSIIAYLIWWFTVDLDSPSNGTDHYCSRLAFDENVTKISVERQNFVLHVQTFGIFVNLQFILICLLLFYE